MWRPICDYANIITILGLLLSAASIYVLSQGFGSLGLSIALIAVLADHLDGVVARRTSNRTQVVGEYGKNLDSFADLLSSGVVPSLYISTAAYTGKISYVLSLAIILITTLRLTKYNVEAEIKDYVTGLSVLYTIPCMSIAHIVTTFINTDKIGVSSHIVIVIILSMQLSKFNMPKLKGIGYFFIVLICVTSFFLLIFIHTINNS